MIEGEDEPVLSTSRPAIEVRNDPMARPPRLEGKYFRIPGVGVGFRLPTEFE